MKLSTNAHRLAANAANAAATGATAQPAIASHVLLANTVPLADDYRMLQMMRTPKLGVRPSIPNAFVVSELNSNSSSEAIVRVFEEGFRVFMYDMRLSTLAEAHQCMRHLTEASRIVSQRLSLNLGPSMLFGIHQRACRLGSFARPERVDLRLKEGDRFILTADRRLHARGTRVAMFCNCANAIKMLTPTQTLRIGGTVIEEDEPAEPTADEAPHVVAGSADVQSASAFQSAGEPAAEEAAPQARSASPQSSPNDAAETPHKTPAAPNAKYKGAVLLSVIAIVRQSIVCVVTQPGRIRPGDAVHMPIKTYSDELTPEEQADIDLALAYGAHSIVVPEPQTADYADSLRRYISDNHTHSPIGIDILVRTERLLSSRRERFITSTYDGCIYTMLHRYCPRSDEPIVPSAVEMDLMRHLFEQRKPFILTARVETGPERNGVVSLPCISDKYPECLHYYPDGFLVTSEMGVEAEANSPHYLYRFRQLLHQIQPIERAMNLRALMQQAKPEATRCGRYVLARCVVMAAYAMNARAIIMATRTGRTALDVAEFRPPCPVYAIVHDLRVGVRLVMHRGIRRVQFRKTQTSGTTRSERAWTQSQNRMHLQAIFSAMQRMMLANNDRIIIMSKSAPAVRCCDTFNTYTVQEFTRHYEALYYGRSQSAI